MLVKFNKSYSFSNNGYETIHAGKDTVHEATAEMAETMINAKVCVEHTEDAIGIEDGIDEVDTQELPDSEDDLTEVYKIGKALATEFAAINIKSFAGLFAFGQTEKGREYLVSLNGITEGNVNSVIDSAKVLAEGE